MKPPTQRETLNFDISRLTKNTSMGSLLARAKQNQIMQKQLSTARNAKMEVSKENTVKVTQENTNTQNQNQPQQPPQIPLPQSCFSKGNKKNTHCTFVVDNTHQGLPKPALKPKNCGNNANLSGEESDGSPIYSSSINLIRNQYSSLTFNPHVPKFKNFTQTSIEVAKLTSSYFVKNSYTVLEYAYKEDQNRVYKDEMEDKGKSIDNFNNTKVNTLFELFDGHGGDYVAKYLQHNFDAIYRKNLALTPSDIEDALRTSFFEIDDKLNSVHNPDVGSTGCVVHVFKPSPYNLKVYCANVGDTRCSLISPTKIKRLSYDHRASDPKEKQRVITLGGVIENDRVDGVLMLTRVFGDFELKSRGVNCNPDITCTNIDLEEKNQYLIIACDGIWDVLSEEDVRQIITFGKNNAEDISKEIMKKALYNNAFYNLSLFVVKLT